MRKIKWELHRNVEVALLGGAHEEHWKGLRVEGMKFPKNKNCDLEEFKKILRWE